MCGMYSTSIGYDNAGQSYAQPPTYSNLRVSVHGMGLSGLRKSHPGGVRTGSNNIVLNPARRTCPPSTLHKWIQMQVAVEQATCGHTG